MIIQLPLSFLSDEITPATDWGFITYREIMFLDSIKVDKSDCFKIEQKLFYKAILLFGLIYEGME